MFELYNNSKDKLLFLPWYKMALSKIVSKLNLKRPFVISFCDNKTMQSVYMATFKKDYITDVLSWQYPEGSYFMGEILLCWPKVKSQAIINRLEYYKEAIRLTVHGLAHLHGLDHDSKESENEMLQWEINALKYAGLQDIYN